MSYEQKPKTIDEVEAVLDDIEIGSDLYPGNPRFKLMRKGNGYLLQFIYDEADVEDRAAGPVPQHCRKWYVSPYSTTTEVVRTAFKAVEASMAHRLGEHFTYQKKQIHSPHLHVDALLEIAEKQDRRA